MLPAPARFSIEDGPLTIAVTGRPVRFDRPAEASSAVVTVLLRQAPAVNGGAAPQTDQSLPSLELVADGVRITSTAPVRIAVEANVLKVTRQQPPAR